MDQKYGGLWGVKESVWSWDEQEAGPYPVSLGVSLGDFVRGVF